MKIVENSLQTKIFFIHPQLVEFEQFLLVSIFRLFPEIDAF